MSRDRSPDKDPWRAAPVIVAQIPEAGLHREIEADSATRHAIAEFAGLREVVSARAAFDLALKRDGKVHVTGRIRARVGQDCVVTLDPIENEIDEPIDLIFAPSEQIRDMADLVDDGADDDAEVPDPPEPIDNGPMPCFSVSIRIRASPVRYSSPKSSLAARRIIRLRRSRC